jgi:hypothetical protein
MLWQEAFSIVKNINGSSDFEYCLVGIVEIISSATTPLSR